MKIKLAIVACGLTAFIAPSAQAFEITGGELTLSYSAFTDHSSASTTSLTGAVEVGFSKNFGVQVDLATYDLPYGNENGTNATIHAIYHVNDATSLGAFYGTDELNGSSLDLYGIEVGHEFGAFGLEAYMTNLSDNGTVATMYGLSGNYALNGAFGLTGSVDRLEFDPAPVSVTRLALGMDYSFTPSMSAYAEVATVTVAVPGDSMSENLYEVGARFSFGANRGVTFEKRSYFGFLGGFF